MAPLRHAPGSEHGFALVTALLVTAILVTMVTEFVYGVYISTSRVYNFRDSERAAVLSATGVEMTRSHLERILKETPHLTMEGGGISFALSEDDMTITVKVVDERSRASIMIVYPDTGVFVDGTGDIYSRLLEVLGLDRTVLLDTLADWMDGDDEPRTYGAEGPDYYRGLERPYNPRNGHPDTIEEILLVKQYTPAVYEKLSPYITVYTDGLVNINTAPKEVLMALSPSMTEDLADRIIDYRREKPFEDRSDIMKVPGFETIGFELQDRIAVQSDTFRVYSRAEVGEAVREVEAVFRTGGGILYWREM